MDSSRYCDTCKAYGNHHTDRHNMMLGINDGITFQTRVNGVSYRTINGEMQKQIDGEWVEAFSKRPSFKKRLASLFS